MALRTGEKVTFLVSGFLGVVAVTLMLLARCGVIHMFDTTDVYEFTAQSKAGYQVYKEKGCNSCHVAFKMGEWGVGPSLDGEGTRRTREWVSAYLENPAQAYANTRHNGKFATDFKDVSSNEKALLEAFLMSLKALPGSPNYPKPPE